MFKVGDRVKFKLMPWEDQEAFQAKVGWEGQVVDVPHSSGLYDVVWDKLEGDHLSYYGHSLENCEPAEELQDMNGYECLVIWRPVSEDFFFQSVVLVRDPWKLSEEYWIVLAAMSEEFFGDSLKDILSEGYELISVTSVPSEFYY
jgi:hypothetical protein